MNEELAEFVGVFIGDGCLSEYARKNRPSNVRVILFTGSWEKDSDYYQRIIKDISYKYFKYGIRIYHRKDDNTVRFFITNKNAISFLIALGYNFGPKSETVFILSVIFNNKNCSLACIRGIFNTDGCIYKRYNKMYRNHKKLYSKYKVVQFKSNSYLLIKQIDLILKRENILVNKIIKDKKASVLRITSQKDIDKFISIVGMNHNYHINRIK